jgi:hypothetical protein
VRLVIENYYAFMGQAADRERLFERLLPEALWRRVEVFLRRLAELPCWIDPKLSTTVFGAKQNREFWKKVFETGIAPTGVRVLAQPIELMQMIKEDAPVRGG